MKKSFAARATFFAIGWLAAILFFFPIFWMGLAAFKPEPIAIATPPRLFFSPTLINMQAVLDRADYLHFFYNSVLISFAATALAIMLATPAAYAMAFFPKKNSKDILVWMLSSSSH